MWITVKTLKNMSIVNMYKGVDKKINISTYKQKKRW